MPGIMDAIANLFHGGANAVRQAALTPEQIEMRDNGKQVLEMIKIASIVSVIASLFFLGIFPNLFTLVLAGVDAFVASEVFKTANNILEMLNKAAVELRARSSKDNLINQLSKDTITVGPLLRAINPPMDRPPLDGLLLV